MCGGAGCSIKRRNLVNGLLVDDKRQNRTPESFLEKKAKINCFAIQISIDFSGEMGGRSVQSLQECFVCH